MAPKIIYPEEIDLFTIPHSRMKELVNKYTQKVQCVDFRDFHETFALLKELHGTLYEFKSHEYIENLFIMDQLKNRLKQRHIYNSDVCDCHNDNRLSKMLSLVKNGTNLMQSSINERLHFGAELQKAFFEFVQQFLPHMEEEENIFQPLLVEHFEYEELRTLKEVVIEQHELLKDPQYQEKAEFDLPEIDEAIKDFRDIDSDIWSLADLFNEEEYKTQEEALCTDIIIKEIGIMDLPTETLSKIFIYLLPPDRGRCAKTCSRFNNIINSPVIWREIYPIQWTRGIWVWEDVKLTHILEDESTLMDLNAGSRRFDEDADIDESDEVDLTRMQKEYTLFEQLIYYLLPKVGMKVEKIVLDAGQGITPRQIRQSLLLCPNVSYLSAAYTNFDYRALKGIWDFHSFVKLRYLDLQGCVNVDDNCLYFLSECLKMSRIPKKRCRFQVCCENNQRCCPCLTYSLDHENVKYAKWENCPVLNGNIFSTKFVKYSYRNSSHSEDVEIEDLAFLRRPKGSKTSLENLNLSGCCEVTDLGLSYLFNERLLENLLHLNISSCFNVSGSTLQTIIGYCPKLKPENLTYCNSITDGPYPDLANGCDNLYHPIKVCCQSRFYQ